MYRSDTLWNIRLAARLGGLWNTTARTLLGADAILDISGGDSFTDLYGEHRFKAVAYTKRIALERGVPLILLPQTYGPFQSPRRREEASRIVRGSRLALARDARSFEVMRELAGTSFDPARHRSGVDVAFLLGSQQPADLSEPLRSWIAPNRPVPLVGFNVSGLIYNDPGLAARRYGLKADYSGVVRSLVFRFTDQTEARMVLIPHVLTPPGHYESDVRASEHVRASLPRDVRARVEVLPACYDQSELKWIIGRMDWFCGTRMHATIAALSSGVPTAAIAYSGKTIGVFETCGQEAAVIDPRSLDTDEVIDCVWRSWERREEARRSLAACLPRALQTAHEQMDLIAAECIASAEARGRTRS